MITITDKEFENNFDKYNLLGQKEIISVTSKDKEIYRIIPKKINDLNTFSNFVGKLPKDAEIGLDPNERG